ncbi:MAG: CehA/McbA family metallohydrolase, partial [Myxococcota bacterium]
YFSATEYDPETGTGRNGLWSDNFDVIEACNGSSFDDNREDTIVDWFSFLEHGRDIWAVGSSDNHHLVRGPVGYPRTCLYLGHDDPMKADDATVRDALLAGAAIVGGGLFMTVEGPGGERPGETVQAAGETVSFTVSVRAPSWISAETLETFVNGVSVDTSELLPMGEGPGQVFLQTVEVEVDASRTRNWVVFHAKGQGDLDPVHPGSVPFAFSNPVFITP